MSNEQVKLNLLSVFYDDTCFVDSVSLSLAKGEIGCLLGPSGCGKTSLLRAVAGFQEKTQGEIHIAGTLTQSDSVRIPAEQRKVGMVFQDIALFPHLNVFQNITFGISNLSKQAQSSRVSELLNLIGLTNKEKAFPHELSGGQQQRVALARALAPEPEIILLDEPFSSLDAELSELMALEIRKLFKARNITALMVTHDQQEAFAVADKIGVMNQGRLLQWDTAYELYHRPNNLFVAGFIGDGAIVSAKLDEQRQLTNGLGVLGSLRSGDIHSGYDILIRPDDIQFDSDSSISGKIIQKRFRGAEYHYEIELSDGQIIICETPNHVDYLVGDRLPVRADLKHLVIFEQS